MTNSFYTLWFMSIIKTWRNTQGTLLPISVRILLEAFGFLFLAFALFFFRLFYCSQNSTSKAFFPFCNLASALCVFSFSFVNRTIIILLSRNKKKIYYLYYFYWYVAFWWLKKSTRLIWSYKQIKNGGEVKKNHSMILSPSSIKLFSIQVMVIWWYIS